MKGIIKMRLQKQKMDLHDDRFAEDEEYNSHQLSNKFYMDELSKQAF